MLEATLRIAYDCCDRGFSYLVREQWAKTPEVILDHTPCLSISRHRSLDFQERWTVASILFVVPENLLTKPGSIPNGTDHVPQFLSEVQRLIILIGDSSGLANFIHEVLIRRGL